MRCAVYVNNFKMYNAFILHFPSMSLAFSCSNILNIHTYKYKYNIDMHADGYAVLYLMCHAMRSQEHKDTHAEIEREKMREKCQHSRYDMGMKLL